MAKCLKCGIDLRYLVRIDNTGNRWRCSIQPQKILQLDQCSRNSQKSLPKVVNNGSLDSFYFTAPILSVSVNNVISSY